MSSTATRGRGTRPIARARPPSSRGRGFGPGQRGGFSQFRGRGTFPSPFGPQNGPPSNINPFAVQASNQVFFGSQPTTTQAAVTLPPTKRFGILENGGGPPTTDPSYMNDTLFLNLKKNREKERAHAIANNLVDDTNKQRRLEDAITFTGTCQDMCPPFERVERIVQKAVDGCEKVVGVDGQEAVRQELMVKRFRRSAAGDDAQLPSDVRPPMILKATLDYLIKDVVGGPKPLAKTHAFLWDRTRSIRNDFTIQNVQGSKNTDLLLAIECYERIARFHIHALHDFARPDVDSIGFTAHNEREQLNKTLLSLMEFYDLCAVRGLQCPNEEELRAYNIIMHFHDQDVEREAMNLGRSRPALYNHPRIQRALELYAAAGNTSDVHGPLKPNGANSIAQNNIGRFFRLIASCQISYTMACVAEIHFNHIRRSGLDAIRAAYKSPGTMQDCTLSHLTGMLGFDNQDQTWMFCQACGMDVMQGKDGEPYLVLNSGADPLKNPDTLKQPFSMTLVERKRHGRTLPHVCNGLTVKQARATGEVRKDNAALFQPGGLKGPTVNPTLPISNPPLFSASAPLGNFTASQGQLDSSSSTAQFGFGAPSLAPLQPRFNPFSPKVPSLHATTAPPSNPFALGSSTSLASAQPAIASNLFSTAAATAPVATGVSPFTFGAPPTVDYGSIPTTFNFGGTTATPAPAQSSSNPASNFDFGALSGAPKDSSLFAAPSSFAFGTANPSATEPDAPAVMTKVPATFDFSFSSNAPKAAQASNMFLFSAPTALKGSTKPPGSPPKSTPTTLNLFGGSSGAPISLSGTSPDKVFASLPVFNFGGPNSSTLSASAKPPALPTFTSGGPTQANDTTLSKSTTDKSGNTFGGPAAGMAIPATTAGVAPAPPFSFLSGSTEKGNASTKKRVTFADLSDENGIKKASKDSGLNSNGASVLTEATKSTVSPAFLFGLPSTSSSILKPTQKANMEPPSSGSSIFGLASATTGEYKENEKPFSFLNPPGMVPSLGSYSIDTSKKVENTPIQPKRKNHDSLFVTCESTDEEESDEGGEDRKDKGTDGKAPEESPSPPPAPRFGFRVTAPAQQPVPATPAAPPPALKAPTASDGAEPDSPPAPPAPRFGFRVQSLPSNNASHVPATNKFPQATPFTRSLAPPATPPKIPSQRVSETPLKSATPQTPPRVVFSTEITPTKAPPKRHLTSKGQSIPSDIAEWYLLSRNGLMDSFIEYILPSLVATGYDAFEEEKAVDFRRLKIMERYFHRWRCAARSKSIAGLGRKSRQRMRHLISTSQKRRRDSDSHMSDSVRSSVEPMAAIVRLANDDKEDESQRKKRPADRIATEENDATPTAKRLKHAASLPNINREMMNHVLQRSFDNSTIASASDSGDRTSRRSITKSSLATSTSSQRSPRPIINSTPNQSSKLNSNIVPTFKSENDKQHPRIDPSLYASTMSSNSPLFLSGRSIMSPQVLRRARSVIGRSATSFIDRRMGDTIRSDYWRLKAAGLETSPNGITQPIGLKRGASGRGSTFDQPGSRNGSPNPNPRKRTLDDFGAASEDGQAKRRAHDDEGRSGIVTQTWRTSGSIGRQMMNGHGKAYAPVPNLAKAASTPKSKPKPNPKPKEVANQVSGIVTIDLLSDSEGESAEENEEEKLFREMRELGQKMDEGIEFYREVINGTPRGQAAFGEDESIRGMMTRSRASRRG